MLIYTKRSVGVVKLVYSEWLDSERINESQWASLPLIKIDVGIGNSEIPMSY